MYDEPCPVCHGSGHGVSSRTIQARIPAGVKDGQKIRLKGKGAAGEQGGSAGDLFVVVKVRPHRLFRRKGDNLTLDVPVRFDEAALGAEITVPTLTGGSGDGADPARHAATGARSGSAAAGLRAATARGATCWSPCRSRRARHAQRAAAGRRSRPTVRASDGVDPRAALLEDEKVRS